MSFRLGMITYLNGSSDALREHGSIVMLQPRSGSDSCAIISGPSHGLSVNFMPNKWRVDLLEVYYERRIN